MRLALTEKGVSWRSKVVDIVGSHANYKPSYMEMNPAGVVPTLTHGSLEITDAIAIAIYVNNNFPGPMLVPTQERERVLMEQWLGLQQFFPEREFTYANLEGLALALATQDIERRKKKLSDYAKKYDDLSDLYRAKLEDVSTLEGYLDDEDYVKRQLEKLDPILAMMDETVRKSKMVGG